MATHTAGEIPSQAPKNKNLLKKGTAALGIAAAAFAGTYAAESISSHHSDQATSENSVSAGPGREALQDTLTLSPEAVDAQKRFDADINAVNAAVRHGLDINNLGYGNYFPVGAGSSSKKMTAEQIVARNTAKQMWVRENSNSAQAERDTAIIAPVGTDAYSAMLVGVHDPNPTNHESIDVDVVKGKPYHFTSGTHNGITSHGDTWLIDVEPVTTGIDYVNVYEWYENPDGKGGEYLNTKIYSEQYTPNFATTYNDLLPHSSSNN